jgi:preprotein translocase subunit SecA
MVKLFGNLFDSNEKELKRLWPKVERINQMEPEFKTLTEDQLHDKTGELKAVGQGRIP